MRPRCLVSRQFVSRMVRFLPACGGLPRLWRGHAPTLLLVACPAHPVTPAETLLPTSQPLTVRHPVPLRGHSGRCVLDTHRHIPLATRQLSRYVGRAGTAPMFVDLRYSIRLSCTTDSRMSAIRSLHATLWQRQLPQLLQSASKQSYSNLASSSEYFNALLTRHSNRNSHDNVHSLRAYQVHPRASGTLRCA